MLSLIKIALLLIPLPGLVMGMNCFICSRTVECRNRNYKDALESIQREEYLPGNEDSPVRRDWTVNYHQELSSNEYDQVFHLQRFKRQTANTTLPIVPAASPVLMNDLTRDILYQVGIVVGSAFASTLILADALPFYSLPGESGGGASPTGPLTPQQRQALSLTPLNRKPLALFPPFDSPRTFPAIAVIFRERPGLDDNTEEPASFPSLQWFRENFALFRRRSPNLFSCINLETELVGYRVQYNFSCFENISEDCNANNALPRTKGFEFLNDNILFDRQIGENFCSNFGNLDCRMVSSGGTIGACENELK